MVLVTINYRLGPLGFMNNKQFYDQNDAVPSYGGMNGLYDQIIALQWTRQFIADFGGDPDHITIFGESAGGLSVCSLLVSPLAKRLFQRAIVQSGSCVGPWYAFSILSQSVFHFQRLKSCTSHVSEHGTLSSGVLYRRPTVSPQPTQC